MINLSICIKLMVNHMLWYDIWIINLNLLTLEISIASINQLLLFKFIYLFYIKEMNILLKN